MFLIVGVVFGIVCAAIASSKGRSVIGWFFIGFLFGLFALIILLVIPNLKEAQAKEEHMEMEQRRLREQLRQEQLKTEQLRKHTQARLDLHDKELDIDTRGIGSSMEENLTQPALDPGLGLSEPTIPEQPIRLDMETESEKMEARCPRCQSRFPVRSEHDGQEVTCPKCSERFVVARFVESSAVGTRPKNEGWYYQDRGAAVGPLSLVKLKQLLREGRIDLRTSIWHESLGDWTPGGRVAELIMEFDGD